ncbi:MAG: hemolysin family protein [Rickettsiaceae bacterium]|uniref:hemolysin family protein n=1 Tax=Candidatus Tisiphia endosymbiont of Ptychoptera albimana TaxID=3066260 RepID=UPI00312C7022|nr:hemolysin family protein [Rickettsiaceae bacterium]MDD9337503.1 hemolysin family protein [Rickettsiaceae bacterium]
MFTSLKKENLASIHSKRDMLKNSSKIVTLKSFFSRLFSKEKLEDNFYDAIKKLKSNSKKMTLEEKKIFMNLLKFGHKTVEDVMIPRSDIKAVKLTASIDELSQMLNSKIPNTRTLVYDETLDNIVGFIHIKDLFKILITKQLITNQELQLKKIIRKPIISAPSMKLIDLLAKMRRDCVQISIVVDEYGGTDGIVTMEDIMEEIVGRIDDEHDKKSDNDSFRIINNNTILSNARVKVEDLESALGVKLKLQNDEFDTIGGLVLAKVGNVPLVGTKIDIEQQVELEVIDASPRSLKQVKLQLKNGTILPDNTL